MIKGGNVTVYVSDMDAAVRFYTEVLGLELRERFGGHWAAIKAAEGFIIGLHPGSEQNPARRPGSMSIGFEVTTAPIEDVIAALKARGVRFQGDVTDDKAGKFAMFADPDGNPCYLYQMSPSYAPR
jgi:catechol 2,3-dioxygenase-like lactoylglutathione lyase family enzyme